MENRGGCMCGKISYKVSGEPVGGMFYCHCNDCKKKRVRHLRSLLDFWPSIFHLRMIVMLKLM